MTAHRIYVASSWKNQEQPQIVAMLRGEGHDVYDFKNPAPGDNGFSWKQIGDRETWTADHFADEVLNHPIAKHGFDLDMHALHACSICVLVLPCGRSAHLELGYAVGQERLTIVYMPKLEEPELMYRMCDYVVTLPSEIARACSSDRDRPHWQRDLEAIDSRDNLNRGSEFSGPRRSAVSDHPYHTDSERKAAKKLIGGSLPKRGPCRDYHHRTCKVCGGCWRHGSCTCDKPLGLSHE